MSFSIPIHDNDPLGICLPFILTHLQQARHHSHNRPLIIGLNGVQGVGKTTLVSALAAALAGEKPKNNGGNNGVKTLVFSLDDFYLTHENQRALSEANPENALIQHRGEPGTHDITLLKSVFTALINAHPTKIPRYDKALFSGQGDRLPEEVWIPVNQPGDEPIQVIIFEGWSVGFRSLDEEEVRARWEAPSRTLRHHQLEHLLFVNDKLRGYDAVTDLLDAFIHIDSEHLDYVYAWRQEQEESLRRARGDPSAGMTPEQVVRFVDGYFPAYELYTAALRKGILKDKPGRQLRMIVGRDRKVKQVERI
ncbi:uncharacterized protein CPUR_07704 [Claviceps purpurea 20.1]|uniref:Uncharacterized protein n=1 Tax=Claviceps purpurea (strain 20.1) TaxID=1111077 RepID=M1WFL5_CLAP2|nr:uncharacterized protein CPUR_07704 [Claviceps purpurea 20.1]